MSVQFQCRSCGAVYSDTTQDGAAYHHACPPLRGETPFEWIERPDKRDENIVHDRDGEFDRIVSEGKGVQCLSDTRILNPQWLIRMRKRRAEKWKEEDD